MFSVSGSMLEIYFTQRRSKKQVTDISPVLKDSDTDSENLSLLIWLFSLFFSLFGLLFYVPVNSSGHVETIS